MVLIQRVFTVFSGVGVVLTLSLALWLVLLHKPAVSQTQIPIQAPTPTPTQTLLIDKAQLYSGVQLDASSPLNSVVPTRATADASTVNSAISLPHNWNSDRPQRKGVHTYQVSFELKAEQIMLPQALYFVRLGNRFEIWLNGKQVVKNPQLMNPHYGAINEPFLLPLSEQDLRLGTNSLAIVVNGEAARFAGLSRIALGDYQTLLTQFENRSFIQQKLPYLIIILCLTMAVFALTLASVLRNKNLLIFGLGSVSWAIATSFELFNKIWFNYKIQLFLYDFTFFLSIICIVSIILATARYKNKFCNIYAVVFLTSCTLAMLAYIAGWADIRPVYLLALLIYSLIAMAIYFYKIYLSPNNKSWLLVGIFSICAAFSIYDRVFVFKSTNGYELYSMVRYSYLLISFALILVYALRVSKLQTLLQQNRVRLNSRIKIARSTITQQFAAQQAAEKHTAQLGERQRIMRDLHDGLGHKIVGLLHSSRAQALKPPELESQLEGLLQEIRLTVSAAHATDANVSDMLGTLREHLEGLCRKTGIQLAWAVDALPSLPELGLDDVAHIQKIIIEAFTNIVKHAKASRVTLRAEHSHAQGLCIAVHNNGLAFDARQIDNIASNAPSAVACEGAVTSGNGLRHMRDRALAAGFDLSFENQGCSMVLRQLGRGL